MKKKIERDPISDFRRRAEAARRIGGRHCACGESRPEALIAGSSPTTCAACSRKKRGLSTVDGHHPAGRANSPVRISIPVNDHRAVLSPAQYDWPTETWENRDASPVLAGAGCVRGYLDTNTYLTDGLLVWVAKLLETLDEVLRDRLGPRWWVGTDLEQFAPKRKKEGNHGR